VAAGADGGVFEFDVEAAVEGDPGAGGDGGVDGDDVTLAVSDAAADVAELCCVPDAAAGVEVALEHPATAMSSPAVTSGAAKARVNSGINAPQIPVCQSLSISRRLRALPGCIALGTFPSNFRAGPLASVAI
jgi:hypothetical protein